MEEKIKTILRHQYPDKYEELHEQTAELICALLDVVGQSEQLKALQEKFNKVIGYNAISDEFMQEHLAG